MDIKNECMKLIGVKSVLDLQSKPLIETLKNKNIPLDERWEVFTDLVKYDIFNRNEIYGDGHIDTLGNNLTLYDTFNIDRRESVSYIDMYERIIESASEFEEENIDDWREEVLQSGYSSFTYDW